MPSQRFVEHVPHGIQVASRGRPRKLVDQCQEPSANAPRAEARKVEGERVVHNPVKDAHFPRMEHEMDSAGCVMHLRGGVTETAINTGTTRIRTILVELLDDPR